MSLLHAGVDTAVIALWLGHADTRSTQIYLHADMTIKERALARVTASPSVKPGRYRPPDNCSPSWRACDYPDLHWRPSPSRDHPTKNGPFLRPAGPTASG